MPMHGERIPATRTMGGTNHPHRAMGQHKRRSFSGGSHSGFGVLGPRRERHNKAAKVKANGQRRTEDHRAIARSLAEHAQPENDGIDLAEVESWLA